MKILIYAFLFSMCWILYVLLRGDSIVETKVTILVIIFLLLWSWGMMAIGARADRDIEKMIDNKKNNGYVCYNCGEVTPDNEITFFAGQICCKNCVKEMIRNDEKREDEK